MQRRLRMPLWDTDSACGSWSGEGGPGRRVSWVRPSPARLHDGPEMETGKTGVVGAWETFVCHGERSHEQPRPSRFRRREVLGILGFDVRPCIQSGRRKRVGNLKVSLPVRNILSGHASCLTPGAGDARTVQSA